MTNQNTLQTMPRWKLFGSIALFILAITVVLTVVYFQARTPPAPGMTDGVLLKCAQCGALKETSAAWVYENWVSDDSVKVTPGAPCPSCNAKALAYAWKCPKDGTVFYRNLHPVKSGSDTRWVPTQVSQRCPACGWSGGENAPPASAPTHAP